MNTMAAQVAMQEVVIVGAGAMGCLFAARLQEAGATVTLIDNNAERLELIGKRGLELIDDFGCRLLKPRALLAHQLSGSVDLVVLFTKGMHSAPAVRSIAHLAQFRPVALTLQNGLGNAEILAGTFGADRVLMGTAHVPADLKAPNTVISHGFAHVSVGGYVPAARRLLDPVAELLSRSRFEATIAADIETAVWEKLAFNAALNAMAMVTGAANGEMNNGYGLRVARAVVDETTEVARAIGLELDPQQIKDAVGMALVQHPAHKASMLQDREYARPTEIENINGAIVTIGAKCGIATPVNATLADLVRIIESKSLGNPLPS